MELDAASLHEQPLRESSSTQRDHHLTPIDVRTTADGDALLRWIRLDGTAPAGTSLGLQYRTAPDALLLNGMDWLPMIGNFSYNHPIGNHTVPEPSTTGTDRAVQEFLDLSPWLQIRIVMATTEGEAWTLPDMDKCPGAWKRWSSPTSTGPRAKLRATPQPDDPHRRRRGLEQAVWCWTRASGACSASWPRNKVDPGP